MIIPAITAIPKLSIVPMSTYSVFKVSLFPYRKMDLAAIKNPTAEYCDTMIKVSAKIRSKTPITFPALGISLSLDTCIWVTLNTSLIKIFAGFKHTKYPVIISKYLKLIEIPTEGLIPCHLSNIKTTTVKIIK